MTVVVGSDLVLSCQLVSNLAQPFWVLNDRELVLSPEEESAGPRFDRALRALVVPQAGALQAGRYVCFSEEQGVKFQTERYQVCINNLLFILLFSFTFFKKHNLQRGEDIQTFKR